MTAATPDATSHHATPLRVAVMPGSLRSGSINRRLGEVIVRQALSRTATEAELIDLGEYELPIYHGDIEADQGYPKAAVRLREYLAGFEGLVIVTPEYNGGPSPLLKNTIDWVSRVDRQTFAQLAIGLAAATPGARGGVHGLDIMRRIGEHMRLTVMPDALSIANAPDVIGTAVDPATADRIDGWVSDYVAFARSSKAARSEAAV